jgi:hypothetical protein
MAAILQPADRLMTFGTDEPSQPARAFTAGALTLDFMDGAVRRLCWHGIEIVRGISCPIRDADWGTYASVLADEKATCTPDAFEIRQERLVADGALRIGLVFQGRADGHFRATAEMSASRDFITNRAGFTLLHPLKDVAGTRLDIAHPDGSHTVSEFPILISPDQVAANISGLRHSVGGIDTEILFGGEVFEMEDQRNWSDASFKTYCRPLALPRPYRLQAGERLRQDIEIRIKGMPPPVAPGAHASGPAVLQLSGRGECFPRLAVAVEEGTVPDAAGHRHWRLLKPAILQLRVTPKTASAVCKAAKAILAASPAEIELEIVIPSGVDPGMALAAVAADCQSSSLAVARVLALPQAYLQSYQPSGPWPAGPRPQDLSALVGACFPGAQVGGGVLTYFTELNRCRPERCDFVTHGSTALTHAADDRSVLESLEGLSHIFKSGRALAGNREYRLGLVAIGMRSNPYGSGVVENLAQGRIAMAGADPRQRGLFAAAWAVGAVAATEGRGISSVALSAFAGSFGVIHRPEAWPQPLYPADAADHVYPLFHVVRSLAEMGGAERLSLSAIGKGITGVAASSASGIRVLLANIGSEASLVRLPREAESRILNLQSFDLAIRNPEWLDSGDVRRGRDVALEPLNVAFLKMPGLR